MKAVNEVLGSLRLEKHPDKTFIGMIERGFDFLGYHFSRDGLRVATATIQRFVERATRLYEQEREEPGGPSMLGAYVRRWIGWASGGLGPAGGSGSVLGFADAGPTPARHEAQHAEADCEKG